MWMELELRDQRRAGYDEGQLDGLSMGILQTTIDFYLTGDITLEKALEKSQMTEEEFLKAVEDYKKQTK